MIRKAGQTRNGEERVDIVSITHRIEKDTTEGENEKM